MSRLIRPRCSALSFLVLKTEWYVHAYCVCGRGACLRLVYVWCMFALNSSTVKSQSLLCHYWECEVYGGLAGFADKRGLTPCMHFDPFWSTWVD